VSVSDQTIYGDTEATLGMEELRSHKPLDGFMGAYSGRPVYLNRCRGQAIQCGTSIEARLGLGARAQGHREYADVADRMNLAATAPHNDLASTKYCLANPETSIWSICRRGRGHSQPHRCPGEFAVEWMHS
jgi:hypothetical protein